MFHKYYVKATKMADSSDEEALNSEPLANLFTFTNLGPGKGNTSSQSETMARKSCRQAFWMKIVADFSEEAGLDNKIKFPNSTRS